MKFIDQRFLIFFNDMDHYLFIAFNVLIVVYGVYFHLRERSASKYRLTAFQCAIVIWTYVVLVKDFSFHLMGFLFLCLFSFSCFFRRERPVFMHYVFFQMGVIFFSFFLLLLSAVGEIDTGGQLALLDMSTITISARGFEGWQRCFPYLAIFGLALSSYTFVGLCRRRWWFEKNCLYYLVLTKAPLLFLVVLCEKNATFISESIRQLIPGVWLVLIFSVVGLGYARRKNSLLNHANNLYVSLFLIVIGGGGVVESGRLYLLLLILMILVLFIPVYFFNRMLSLLSLNGEADGDFFEVSGKSPPAAADPLFRLHIFPGHNIAFYWMMMLLPGGAGIYLLIYGICGLNNFSPGLSVMFSVAYFLSIAIIAGKMIDIFIKSGPPPTGGRGVARDDNQSGLRFNLPVYPLVGAHILIVLYEILWGRII